MYSLVIVKREMIGILDIRNTDNDRLTLLNVFENFFIERFLEVVCEGIPHSRSGEQRTPEL